MYKDFGRHPSDNAVHYSPENIPLKKSSIADATRSKKLTKKRQLLQSSFTTGSNKHLELLATVKKKKTYKGTSKGLKKTAPNNSPLGGKSADRNGSRIDPLPGTSSPDIVAGMGNLNSKMVPSKARRVTGPNTRAVRRRDEPCDENLLASRDDFSEDVTTSEGQDVELAGRTVKGVVQENRELFSVLKDGVPVDESVDEIVIGTFEDELVSGLRFNVPVGDDVDPTANVSESSVESSVDASDASESADANLRRVRSPVSKSRHDIGVGENDVKVDSVASRNKTAHGLTYQQVFASEVTANLSRRSDEPCVDSTTVMNNSLDSTCVSSTIFSEVEGKGSSSDVSAQGCFATRGRSVSNSPVLLIDAKKDVHLNSYYFKHKSLKSVEDLSCTPASEVQSSEDMFYSAESTPPNRQPLLVKDNGPSTEDHIAQSSPETILTKDPINQTALSSVSASGDGQSNVEKSKGDPTEEESIDLALSDADLSDISEVEDTTADTLRQIASSAPASSGEDQSIVDPVWQVVGLPSHPTSCENDKLNTSQMEKLTEVNVQKASTKNPDANPRPLFGMGIGLERLKKLSELRSGKILFVPANNETFSTLPVVGVQGAQLLAVTDETSLEETQLLAVTEETSVEETQLLAVTDETSVEETQLLAMTDETSVEETQLLAVTDETSVEGAPLLAVTDETSVEGAQLLAITDETAVEGTQLLAVTDETSVEETQLLAVTNETSVEERNILLDNTESVNKDNGATELLNFENPMVVIPSPCGEPKPKYKREYCMIRRRLTWCTDSESEEESNNAVKAGPVPRTLRKKGFARRPSLMKTLSRRKTREKHDAARRQLNGDPDSVSQESARESDDAAVCAVSEERPASGVALRTSPRRKSGPKCWKENGKRRRENAQSRPVVGDSREQGGDAKSSRTSKTCPKSPSVSLSSPQNDPVPTCSQDCGTSTADLLQLNRDAVCLESEVNCVPVRVDVTHNVGVPVQPPESVEIDHTSVRTEIEICRDVARHSKPTVTAPRMRDSGCQTEPEGLPVRVRDIKLERIIDYIDLCSDNSDNSGDDQSQERLQGSQPDADGSEQTRNSRKGTGITAMGMRKALQDESKRRKAKDFAKNARKARTVSATNSDETPSDNTTKRATEAGARSDEANEISLAKQSRKKLVNIRGMDDEIRKLVTVPSPSRLQSKNEISKRLEVNELRRSPRKQCVVEEPSETVPHASSAKVNADTLEFSPPCHVIRKPTAKQTGSRKDSNKAANSSPDDGQGGTVKKRQAVKSVHYPDSLEFSPPRQARRSKPGRPSLESAKELSDGANIAREYVKTAKTAAERLGGKRAAAGSIPPSDARGTMERTGRGERDRTSTSDDKEGSSTDGERSPSGTQHSKLSAGERRIASQGKASKRAAADECLSAGERHIASQGKASKRAVDDECRRKDRNKSGSRCSCADEGKMRQSRLDLHVISSKRSTNGGVTPMPIASTSSGRTSGWTVVSESDDSDYIIEDSQSPVLKRGKMDNVTNYSFSSEDVEDVEDDEETETTQVAAGKNSRTRSHSPLARSAQVVPGPARCISQAGTRYSERERRALVAYIEQERAYGQLKGRSFWQQMERDGACPGRSWASLKEHFMKRIMPRIRSYASDRAATEHFQSEIEQNEVRTALNASIPSTDNPKGLRYTRAEDEAIIEYVSQGRRYMQVKGNKLWQAMQRRRIVKGRPWTSLKERYRRYICNNLNRYELPPDLAKKMGTYGRVSVPS